MSFLYDTPTRLVNSVNTSCVFLKTGFQISRCCFTFSFSCQPHKCHYGACPPCKLICGEELSCGHTCKQRFVIASLFPVDWILIFFILSTGIMHVAFRCHGPIPPPNPEFTLKPKKKKRPAECVPGSSCSPCQEVIWMPCLGQHIGEDRPVSLSSLLRWLSHLNITLLVFSHVPMLVFRWFAPKGCHSPVRTCVEIFFLAAIITAPDLVMFWNYQSMKRRQ